MQPSGGGTRARARKRAVGVDPDRVPKRKLAGGSLMPAVGLGTFGSDHVGPEDVARAVRGAFEVGYRHFDCAAVYGNEAAIGRSLSRLPREEIWVTSKLWNDKHAPEDVHAACRQSLTDLQLDYLDMYLVHWPFPNSHPPGCDVTLRAPNARPYVHDEFMETWEKMEELVDLGLVRHIGTSNTTIPKLRASPRRRTHSAGRERDGAASAFPAARALRVPECPGNHAHSFLPHRLTTST